MTVYDSAPRIFLTVKSHHLQSVHENLKKLSYKKSWNDHVDSSLKSCCEVKQVDVDMSIAAVLIFKIVCVICQYELHNDIDMITQFKVRNIKSVNQNAEIDFTSI